MIRSAIAAVAMLGIVVLGLGSGVLVGMFAVVVQEPPTEAAVEELLADAAIRAEIEDRIVEAVDEEVELPLLDAQLNSIVEIALRSESGTEVVTQVVQAAVDREFSDGPGSVQVRLGSFVDDLPSVFGLVEGLLDREVTVELPAEGSAPASEWIRRWMLAALAITVVLIGVAGGTARPGRRLASLLGGLAVASLAAAAACALLPSITGLMWSDSSDLSRRLLLERMTAGQPRLWMLAGFLIGAAIGGLASSLLLRRKPQQSDRLTDGASSPADNGLM